MVFCSSVALYLMALLPSLSKDRLPPPNFMACVKCVPVRQAYAIFGEKDGINASASHLAALAARQESKCLAGTFTTSML